MGMPGRGPDRGGRGPGRPRGRGRPAGGERRPGAGRLGLRPVEGGGFELVHPGCVEEVALDVEEAMEAWRAGEPEEARDLLRYALEGCHDNLWAHAALGRLALEQARNPSLARGHFGYAYELALRAFPRDFAGPLPRGRAANRPFFDAMEGLIACADALGRAAEASELRRRMARLAGPSGGRD